MVAPTTVKTKVVDADGHYNEPPHALPEYIEPKYRDIAPRIVKDAQGKEFWIGRGWGDAPAQPLVPRPASVTGGHAGVARWRDGDKVENPGNQGLQYSDINQGGIDPNARLKVLDEEGMDIAVMYPTSALAWVEDGDYHQALNRALNDWFADFRKADPERLYGAANIVGIHDMDWACDEATRCVNQLGFKSIFLRMGMVDPDTRWWQNKYDRFWAVCQDLDVAVGFHPFPSDSMYGAPRLFDMRGPSPEQVFIRVPFNHPVDAMNVTAGLIVGGILERFPQLRVGILESGGGWMGPFLERLDERFEHFHKLVPHLKMKPSDYFRRQGWISFDPEEMGLKLNAEWIGADRIIWGSDFPHGDAFYPGFLDMLNHNIGGMSEEDQKRIRGLNAADFYRLALD